MIVVAKDGDRVIMTDDLPDDLGIPPVVLAPMHCGECKSTHLMVFRHKGLHDDGEIYQLQK